MRKKKLAYASDGHILQFQHLHAQNGGEECGKNNRPLIPSADWKKMCLAAGDGAEVKCCLTIKKGRSRWICECNGVISCFYTDRGYPDPVKVVTPVSAENLLALSGDTWKELRKNLKAIKNKDAVVLFRHEERAGYITVTVESPGEKTGETTVFSYECAATPEGRYFFAAKVHRIVKVKNFLLYVPEISPNTLQFHDNGGRLTLITQTPVCGETAYRLPASNTFTPLDFCSSVSKDTKEVINEEPKAEAKTAAVPVAVQPMKAEAPGEEVQNTATAHIIEEVVPQCKAKQEPQKLEVSEKPLNEVKEAKAAAPAKEVVSRKEAVKAAPPLDMDAKKFAFAKVGVNIGDTLTFIDGTKVTAAAGNKVEYKGVLYTLSGFCKAFMPESKRNKADAYRGCEYFYNAAGVKLGKLFKEYQKSVAVPLEVQNEEEGKAKNKAVKPLKRSVRTITRPNKEKATETKGSGRVYSWLRRTLGRVHRIAAAFSLL